MDLDFNKGGGLLPVIMQDDRSEQVLMLGYMNEEAYRKTQKEGRLTFFSRTRNRLWTKGETSGNYLFVKELLPDCDHDTLLARVIPKGVVCHTGQPSCFDNTSAKGFIYHLEQKIDDRITKDSPNSYTAQLYRKGINKVAQKVGEEAVELVIEAKDDNDRLFKEEAADLLYHFLILLRTKGIALESVESILKARSSGR